MSSLDLLIGFLPLLALLALLCFRRYPGEKLIERLRQLIDGRHRDAPRTEPGGRCLNSLMKPVRGGQLIARSMAGRAPPLSV
ncbi:MAG: hypothetical protein WBP55_11450 [Solirubrobacterales bacterium]